MSELEKVPLRIDDEHVIIQLPEELSSTRYRDAVEDRHMNGIGAQFDKFTSSDPGQDGVPTSNWEDFYRGLVKDTPPTPVDPEPLEAIEALKPDPGDEEDFRSGDSPFAFTPEQLNKLLNPKSLATNHAMGDLAGIGKDLQTDLRAGLTVDELEPASTVTFEEVTTIADKSSAAADLESVPALSRNRSGWHFDLKPENILMYREEEHRTWKLSDLGLTSLTPHHTDSTSPRCSSIRELAAASLAAIRKNGRKAICVMIKGKENLGCPDSGSDKNIMSEEFARSRQLKIRSGASDKKLAVCGSHAV
jgi:hypothetical protein